VKYPFTFLNVTSPPEEVPVEDEGAGEDQADD
jgi:hypothetical protein